MAKSINKSQLFKMAHTMLRKAEVANLSQALRKAWQVMKLHAQMLVGKVEFSYRKTTGEVRKAVGTLFNINYTPKPQAENKPRRQRPADVVCYFDVEKNSFRSFCAANLI